MRFDPETWENVYEVPKELSPVIEFLTNRDRSRGEALLEIYRVTERFMNDPDPHCGAVVGEIRRLVPGDVKPLQ